MSSPARNELKPDMSHYHSTGFCFILIGVLNMGVALYALFQGADNSFINYDSMLLFSLSFLALGGWMRSQ